MDNKIREFALREAEKNAELVWNRAWEAGYNRAREEYANQPAADVAPVRRGHWIKCGYACGEAEFKCSLCGEIEWRTNETDYCPNCGAKMEVPNDD